MLVNLIIFEFGIRCEHCFGRYDLETDIGFQIESEHLIICIIRRVCVSLDKEILELSETFTSLWRTTYIQVVYPIPRVNYAWN